MECTKKISRTEENPGRKFWSCPIDGWMGWVGYLPNRGVNERLFNRVESELAAKEAEVESLCEELRKLKRHITCL